MDESLVFATVQMTPSAFRRMVIHRTFRHAMLTMELGRGVCQPHVHALLVFEAFDTCHVPRSRRREYALVKGYKIHSSHLSRIQGEE